MKGVELALVYDVPTGVAVVIGFLDFQEARINALAYTAVDQVLLGQLDCLGVIDLDSLRAIPTGLAGVTLVLLCGSNLCLNDNRTSCRA